MYKYQCSVCGGNCDAGELVNHVCPECIEEQKKKELMQSDLFMIMKSPFEQMELSLGELNDGKQKISRF